MREKGRDLTQSYDKSPYIHRHIQKATRKQKNATKKPYASCIQSCISVAESICAVPVLLDFYIRRAYSNRDF